VVNKEMNIRFELRAGVMSGVNVNGKGSCEGSVDSVNGKSGTAVGGKDEDSKGKKRSPGM